MNLAAPSGMSKQLRWGLGVRSILQSEESIDKAFMKNRRGETDARQGWVQALPAGNQNPSVREVRYHAKDIFARYGKCKHLRGSIRIVQKGDRGD